MPKILTELIFQITAVKLKITLERKKNKILDKKIFVYFFNQYIQKKITITNNLIIHKQLSLKIHTNHQSKKSIK